MMTVTKSRPKATEMAIGIRNCAWKLLLSISGVRPATVVTEVRRMGRKRLMPASQMASRKPLPAFMLLLKAATKTRASLTRIPMSAMRPRMLKRLICAPSIQWPMLMPTMPNGMRANTAAACSGERKARMTMKNIRAKMSGMMA